MNRNSELYSLLYGSEYNIANIKEIADKIRNEKNALLCTINIKFDNRLYSNLSAN